MAHYAGTYCTYDLNRDVNSNVITFSGFLTNSPTTTYAFTLGKGASPGYEAPADDNEAASLRTIRSKGGSIDLVRAPSPLPENRTKTVLSFGQGKTLASPIRLQIGSQDPNDQHSGSGLIHLMFSHGKSDLNNVITLFNTILLPTNLGAIYKTKKEQHGHIRYVWLSRNKLPLQLVTEQHPTHYRVLTVYKGTEDITKYHKFKKKPDEYALVYSWNNAIY